MNGWIDGFLPMWAPLVAMIQQGTAIFGVLPALSSLHNPIQGKWSVTTVVFQLDAKVHVIVWETFDEIISRKKYYDPVSHETSVYRCPQVRLKN